MSVKRESTVDLLLLSRLIYEDRRVQFVRDQGSELPSPGLIISLGLRLGLFGFVSFTQGSGLALLEEKRKAVCETRVICSN